MPVIRFRTTSPDKAVVKLYREAMFGTARAAPAEPKVTYRIIVDGTEVRSHADAEAPMSLHGTFEQWLRRQHPADIVRIVLMTAAIAAVVLAVIRIG
ncbi:MAG: hypothetical protein M3N06_06015 [Pseudomonadota bacterium]|nr:hypothetical protein [Pseudomonadota bacterium]